MTWRNTKCGKAIQTISKFVKWTGATVLASDDLSVMSVGWIAFYIDGGMEIYKQVSIPISVMTRETKNMIERGDGETRALGNALKTGAGRHKIANFIPGQRKSDYHEPTFTCGRCGSKTWVDGFDPRSHSDRECDEMLIREIHDE